MEESQSPSSQGLNGATSNPPSIELDAHQKHVILSSIIVAAKSLLGIPYDIEPGPPVVWTGRGKWLDLTKPPIGLDCSGLAAGVCHKVGLKFPDGAQQQFNFTVATNTPRPGDFGFFGVDKDITKIHHVGIILDQIFMIEARGHDPKASFPTGLVIERPRGRWEAYKDFCGYRSHPRIV